MSAVTTTSPATSFLDSSELAASGFNTVIKSEEADDDTPLVVDDDEVGQQFGETQYNEANIIPYNSEEPDEAKAQTALREAVLSSTSDTKDIIVNPDVQSRWTDEPTVDDPEVSFRCLICMDKYCKPVISVKCWHVHCEECWLRTLGAKKLCPQCNVITSPADLRRIFL
ncbi:RNF220 [Bugula neritina]|uniref:RNF220 n=1 Tax=Bugula neritina TaxID=10212 RepID=A0A7J7JCI8_BUGNE|nr:RNF220 [Bugula neritina]